MCEISFTFFVFYHTFGLIHDFCHKYHSIKKHKNVILMRYFVQNKKNFVSLHAKRAIKEWIYSSKHPYSRYCFSSSTA